jgi:hypothetical protein
VWEVEVSDEFEGWWDDLDADEQDSVDFVVELLVREGPLLPYPYSSDVTTAKKHDIRELRIQHQGRPYRVLYVFDPRRHALLLVGGDKTGDDRWYEANVPRAERIYSEYLKELKRGGLIP